MTLVCSLRLTACTILMTQDRELVGEREQGVRVASTEEHDIGGVWGWQAERWGSELLTEDVESVDLSQRPFLVRSTDTEVAPPAMTLPLTQVTCRKFGLSRLPECSCPSLLWLWGVWSSAGALLWAAPTLGVCFPHTHQAPAVFGIWLLVNAFVCRFKLQHIVREGASWTDAGKYVHEFLKLSSGLGVIAVR